MLLQAELAAARQAQAQAAAESAELLQLRTQVAEANVKVAEHQLTISHLQKEREFLQQQYDELKRSPMPASKWFKLLAPTFTIKQVALWRTNVVMVMSVVHTQMQPAVLRLA